MNGSQTEEEQFALFADCPANGCFVPHAENGQIVTMIGMIGAAEKLRWTRPEYMGHAVKVKRRVVTATPWQEIER